MKRAATANSLRIQIIRVMRRLTFIIIFLFYLSSQIVVCGEHLCELEVSEGVPIGHQIGFIGEFLHDADSGPPYLIVPVQGSAIEPDLLVDQTSGEIRTKVQLDRENRASYSFVAIPTSGENIRVIVRVLDENDNAPTFPSSYMHIEFPENTPRDVKRTLNPARDFDLGRFNTQRYNIVAGNVNNAFRLSSHRERDGVLYLDLQINGFLDRETTPSYSLVIEAIDGGNPPLRGQMTVNITIQDVNDNQPIFNQSRYFASIPENATIGTKVLQVYATDTDSGNNGLIEFSINRRQSDKDQMFRIDSKTGIISVNKPLDFETKELHELVVVARDHGEQPLETTAFVSIRVTDVNDNQPIINVIFLSDDATPKISESAQSGEFVARISVNDPDSKTEYSNVNVSLSGGDGRFGLTTRDNIIYLVITSLPLDRETQPNYTLSVIASDQGTPPLHASKTIFLKVTDVNDNAPEFEKQIYNANVVEVADPGTFVIQVTAHDRDDGNNSIVAYTLIDTPETHSQWFQVHQHSGLITTRTQIDCETDPQPKIIVMAKDNGIPTHSSTATVLVTIHDINDNEPIFDQSFYNATVSEKDPKGRCILKVSASDPDCGVNAMVNYTIGDGYRKITEFEIKHNTGDICISDDLDFERRSSYEFPIIAMDRGGLSTTAMVKIQVTDVNDNRPIFYPREYNVSLRETETIGSTSIAAVVATDADSGRFGSISYRIVSGNEAGIFRIDRVSGEIFISKPNMLSSRLQPNHKLNISASDGGGLKSIDEAEVFISVLSSQQRPPMFEKSRYSYAIKENATRGTIVGSVSASSSHLSDRKLRYSIVAGDPDAYFTIDEKSGNIRIDKILDHEKKTHILLNVQAASTDPPDYGHTQVNIEIEDVNDNPPEFETNTVRISLPENVELGSPLYAANARDKDSGNNKIVRYRLASIDGKRSDLIKLFAIEETTGHLTLLKHLDYETSQKHTIVVTATDMGIPPLQANLTILVEVQDVNDNPPVFEQNEYSVNVLESMPINSQIIQVAAVDIDTGNNARITYRIIGGQSKASNVSAVTIAVSSTKNLMSLRNVSEVFGIFPNNGWIYLRDTLDREICELYDITVLASDNGTPAATAESHVIVNVLDANDNAPVFEQDFYEFSVEENVPRNTIVGKVSAEDIDVGINAEIRYNLITNNTNFQINTKNGEIVTRELLDREAAAKIDLMVEAHDMGTSSHSSRVTVQVTVLDVNDNSPEIIDPIEDMISVREGQPSGTDVARVRAIDRDDGYNATITYSILKGRDSDGFSLFTIDPMNGIIKTRVSFDREDRSIYRLAVAATDGGKPPKQTVRLLRVEILDLNDNRPTFTSSNFIFKVHENALIGHVVGTINETEKMDENNSISESHVVYKMNSLFSDSSERAFVIDPSTGALVLAQQLDREKRSEYNFEVRVSDRSSPGNPPSSAIAMKIEVIDVNDNRPHWPNDPVEINIEENAVIGMPLYNFTATDADEDANGVVRYELVEQLPLSEQKIFMVNSITGTLTHSLPIDFEDVKEYILTVKATDQSKNVSERLSSFVTAHITLIDVNDNAPKFISPNEENAIIFVSETMSIGQTILKVLAIDKDSGINGQIKYSIVNGNSYFTIDSINGTITLERPFIDNSMNAFDTSNRRHSLVVSASDLGQPTSLTTKITIQIIVQESNNNPPRFVESIYHANVTENVPAGTFVVQVRAKSFQSKGGGNLTYEIPLEVVSNHFAVDSVRGVVTTKGSIDRELKDSYTVPVYAIESVDNRECSSKFDVAFVIVQVNDVNDHAPEFKSGVCYPLSVPENSETSVIHTVVATDADEGANAEILYSISSGNFGNKFSINSRTGEITARSLDRETQSRFVLQITAQDRGTPTSYQGTCNISVSVEDQNDNDPRFEVSKYTASVAEDVPVSTSVLQVKAADADIGVNARITYSLVNETNWAFSIDSRTGVISTASLLDREITKLYNFMVIATDSGRYEARSERVPVQIIVEDVNDNRPVFFEYPFRVRIPSNIQPGQTILEISAEDNDFGSNGEIVYSLVNDITNGRLRINARTGVLSAAQSLSGFNGNLMRLEVIASDKGNPPQSTIGLVELQVGELRDISGRLSFQNESYTIIIAENSPYGQRILQLNAYRSDGRRQQIAYSIERGNEDDSFSIDSKTGEIIVNRSDQLDYEKRNEIKLIAAARTDGLSSPLFAYTTVIVKLQDVNDNAPRFTQRRYEAAVAEGDGKGTFVANVLASDIDEGTNSGVLYHIVDGNHDNAFVIEPAFSGTVKTNIVLDREIRDVYRLKIIATDQGVPQMTGTTTINVHIIDVNDNRPSFPPRKSINISEDTEPGTVLTIMSANDVDLYPPLVYSLEESHTDKETLSAFEIDRYSGKIILKKSLDYEMRHEYELRVTASDSKYVANSSLLIQITDVNDNAPVFDKLAYYTSVPEKSTINFFEILTLNATDADSDKNADIHYYLERPVAGFSIDEHLGALFVNTSQISHNIRSDVQLYIAAVDSGVPPLKSIVSVRVRVKYNERERPHLVQNQYRSILMEDASLGTVILKLSDQEKYDSSSSYAYAIVSGNENNTFDIVQPSNSLVLVKAMDRETIQSYNLRLQMNDIEMPINTLDNSTGVNVFVIVEDVNDNAPVFERNEYATTVSEAAPLKYSIERVKATDADLESSPNSEIVYSISSGNDAGLFSVDLISGVLSVNGALDYDQGSTDYNLTIRACDSGLIALCSIGTVHVKLSDENDNEPFFPLSEYVEFIGENEPVSVSVFTARAVDLDRGIYGKLNYSVAESLNGEDGSELFSVDSESGIVRTNDVFDYEQKNSYAFVLKASDAGGKFALIKVKILIESRDEFSPQFTERTYRFNLPTSGSEALPIGYIVGHVIATDRDSGVDGRIVYQLTAQHPYFKINRTTGAIMIRKKLDNAAATLEAGHDISLVVTASSGRQGSLTNMTVVEIALDPLFVIDTNLASTIDKENGSRGFTDWALGLFISFILIVITFSAVFISIHIRNRRHRQVMKPNLSNETVGGSSNSYVDPSAFDTMPIRSSTSSVSGTGITSAEQFAPPKYDEIPPYRMHAGSSNSGNATTSELSGSERSGSSGHGSAEDDGDDEEIRMINEGSLQNEGCHDDGRLSDASVQNTQEYLARLGIVDNTTGNGAASTSSRRCSESVGVSSTKDTMLQHGLPIDALNIFDEEQNDNDITNLIYAKLNDVNESEHGSNADEAAVSGSNIGNAVDHVMMGTYSNHPVVGVGGNAGPSMTGSLSSIVHSEEELTGSYNWDYLLDWGPQYQPLAHVFSEIARLKDDTMSLHSANSGASSAKSKMSLQHANKNLPPPLLTNIAPRSVPVLSARGNSNSHLGSINQYLLPRSPISHDASGGFSTSSAMSPSFSPSLSPLATRSPSISPHVPPTGHHLVSMQRQQMQPTRRKQFESNLRVRM